jgi:hypothetical protein
METRKTQISIYIFKFIKVSHIDNNRYTAKEKYKIRNLSTTIITAILIIIVTLPDKIQDREFKLHRETNKTITRD